MERRAAAPEPRAAALAEVLLDGSAKILGAELLEDRERALLPTPEPDTCT